jgi:hypothetical protein
VTDTLDTGEGDGQQDPQGDNPNIRQLREKAKAADEALAALAQAKRENVILRSGIDVDSKLGQMFLKAYDGDLDDIEALKAAAKEIGVPFRGEQPAQEAGTGNGSEDPPEPTGTPERQALASEAPADTGESPNPVEIARERFKASLGEGATEEAAQADFINTLARAAIEGDRRVIVE